jgi:hypothetical protein
MARENTFGLPDKDWQVLDTGEDVHPELSRFLSHCRVCSQQGEQH